MSSAPSLTPCFEDQTLLVLYEADPSPCLAPSRLSLGPAPTVSEPSLSRSLCLEVHSTVVPPTLDGDGGDDDLSIFH